MHWIFQLVLVGSIFSFLEVIVAVLEVIVAEVYFESAFQACL